MSCAKRVRARVECRLNIRTMTEHELIEVCEIEEECHLSLWGWDAYYAELNRPESILLVAGQGAGASTSLEVDGFIVSRVVAGEMHINNIGVRPRARRSGIGSALLGAALRSADEMGALEAILEVRAGNKAARELYQRFGFEVVGRRPHYYLHPKEDALIMTARLKVEG